MFIYFILPYRSTKKENKKIDGVAYKAFYRQSLIISFLSSN
ncbi:hypothetical protein HMPREF3191_00280 [Veillonellaceae bacterium DNF00626]|nr:hypothetical protein HMPREF3191_00280 [Veillonellaceae bacterium DNF00626]